MHRALRGVGVVRTSENASQQLAADLPCLTCHGGGLKSAKRAAAAKHAVPWSNAGQSQAP